MLDGSNQFDKKTLGTSRIFNAPIELVWRVWSEQKHLDNWWGPKGFTQTTHQHSFVEGGAWNFTMHGPNGVDYKNEMQYGEIKLFQKIVIKHLSLPKFTITANFYSINSNCTKVEFNSVFEEQSSFESVLDFAILGNLQHQIRFEIELAKLSGGEAPIEFSISREFHASSSLMWEMFTDPKHMAKWYGPKETKIGYCDLDLKRGGHYHFSMIAEDGSESWGKAYYLDIINNSRLVFVNTFSDKAGSITRHPMAPLMPQKLLTFINFIDLKNGKTKVEINWLPIDASPEEIKFFNQMHESFKMGWTGSLDRLESLVNLI